MTELETSYLIQRFTDPPKKTGGVLDNAHRVFGGGMMQMKDELWDLLDEIFTVDYMGAAEFEFGILPRTLGAIHENADKYVRGKLVLKKTQYKANYMRTARQTRSDPMPEKQDREVFYLCDKGTEEAVKARLKELAKDTLQHKERPRFAEALDPVRDWDKETKGWLDLNNAFMFFVDEEMFKKTCDLLGVKE